MNKHEFYAASLARDKALEKQVIWLSVGLLAILLLPALVFIAVIDYIPVPIRPTFGYTIIGLELCCLIASYYFIQSHPLPQYPL